MTNFSKRKPLIGLTIGDPAGIGPEIVVKLLALKQVRQLSTVVVFGHRSVLDTAVVAAGMGQLGGRLLADLRIVEPDWTPVEFPPWGVKSDTGGRLALLYLDTAIDSARAGATEAIVTAPVSKESIARHWPGFIGQTEYLGQAFGCAEQVSMLLQVEPVRVLHLTTHCSLQEAIRALTESNLLQKIRQAWQLLADMHAERRSVAVLGLNPHAGEGGLFGNEERTIIEPAIRQAQSQGIDVVGPLPPDSAFVRARRGEFGLVLAMYHDQGHIPLKLLGWKRGVNITVGLPVVRTSPDHGTAWDIAGQGVADVASLKEAWRVACQLVGSRQ